MYEVALKSVGVDLYLGLETLDMFKVVRSEGCGNLSAMPFTFNMEEFLVAVDDIPLNPLCSKHIFLLVQSPR